MFYAEILPSALPDLLMHPYGRTASSHGGAPMRMGAWGPEMRPRRCTRRQPKFDDFLSSLLEFNSDSEEEDSSETPTIDVLLRALFEDRATKEKCSKSKCEREAEEMTGSKEGTKCKTKTKGEAKQKCDYSDPKSDKPNDSSHLATLNMRGCDPNSIEVKILHEKKVVIITAKHAVFTPFGPMMRQNQQTVPIPEGVSPKEIRSFISPDGLLYLKVSTPTDTTSEIKLDEESAANTTETVKDVLSRLFEFSSNSEEDASETPTIDVLLRALFEDRTTKEKCSKSTCEREAEEMTGSKEGSKCQTKTKGEVKPTCGHSATKSDKPNDSSHLATLNMRGCDPNSIEVKILHEKKIVIITAKHAVFTPLGPMMRQHHQTVPIPEGVSPKAIRSFISPDGLLYLKVSTPTDTTSEMKQDEEKAANTTETVKDGATNQTSNGDAESTVSEDTQLTNVDTNTALDSSPTENSLIKTKNEAEHFHENPDVTMDFEENENRKQDSDSTAPLSEHDFVVVEAKSEDESDVTKPANDDSTDDVPNTDEANGHTVAQFDMAGFSVEDIKVKINEEARIMEVSAKREENTENGRFVREYFRAFPLPGEFSRNSFQSNLSSEGVFSIQAPNNGMALTQ